MRWSKIKQPDPYSSQVAVLMQEVSIKLPVSMVLYALEMGGPRQAVLSIAIDLRERSSEWLQLAVPALLYTVQNTLLYVGYANAEAAVGQITYQSKILWTALFSIVILGKKLTITQWLALVVLALGVVAVQGVPSGRSTHSKQAKDATEQQRLLGIAALTGAAICTAVASVYFEKMLKGASKPSLWLRNIQLAVYSSIIAVIGLLCSEDEALVTNGWMGGFTVTTWLSVTWQALGGIVVCLHEHGTPPHTPTAGRTHSPLTTHTCCLPPFLQVAVTIKHADNILRGFAQAVALIVGSIGSHFLFSFDITRAFLFGVALVISAIFLYGGTCDTRICGGTGDEHRAVSATFSSSEHAAGSHSGAYIMVPQNASRVQVQPVMVFEEGSEDDSPPASPVARSPA